MVEERAPREGLGLMGVGGAVFVAAALVAAVVSPLAGELTRTIRDAPSPAAQAASVGEHAVPRAPAVKVLSLPPMFAIAGPPAAGAGEPTPGRAPRGLRRGLGLSAHGPTPLSPVAPPAVPAPATDHAPTVDPAIQAPTALPESKPAPGRSGDASADRATAAGSEPRNGKDKLRTRPERGGTERGGKDATVQGSAPAEDHPSRRSERRPS